MATPPTWVHDIGSVGYAGRKEFVGSPLQERTKVYFRRLLIEDARSRWRAALSCY